ncbi:hypothetical protein M0802_012866 [Mischocyttarus mexicanus]|nr:hypothetical protein M0802_012866 [Mischocyttarus mexicanus]
MADTIANTTTPLVRESNVSPGYRATAVKAWIAGWRKGKGIPMVLFHSPDLEPQSPGLIELALRTSSCWVRYTYER